jgi:hypothetical protein
MHNYSPYHSAFPDTLDGQKEQAVCNEHTRAAGFLKYSDFHVLRKIEDGTEIPATVSQYRAQVFSVLDTRLATIAACTSIEEIDDLYHEEPGEAPKAASIWPFYPELS